MSPVLGDFSSFSGGVAWAIPPKKTVLDPLCPWLSTSLKGNYTWNPNGMILNLYIENGCFTKHPSINGWPWGSRYHLFSRRLFKSLDIQRWSRSVFWGSKDPTSGGGPGCRENHQLYYFWQHPIWKALSVVSGSLAFVLHRNENKKPHQNKNKESFPAEMCLSSKKK